MLPTVSRRIFLRIAGTSLLVPSALRAAEVPELLDHIILGCDDLNRGITFVEEHTGVHAAFGGIHPGRGTCNALLKLGEHQYLEIIAPDPKQPGVKQYPTITKMTVPRLVGWAVHPGDIDGFAKKLRQAEVPFDGPRPGSRARPDGRILKWRSLGLTDDHNGLLPFAIEWSPDSVHPAVDAPAGCRLQQFVIVSPDAEEISRLLRRIGIDAPVEAGVKAGLRAVINSPKGSFAVSS